MENNDKKSGSEESISQAEIEINSQITEIDRLINLQLNEILHHPEFQHLEASWRGLHYLINETQPNQHLKIKVFQVWKKELLKDFERSIEFDQSTLFKRVCDDIYSTFGEDPFGLLIGDYEFNNNFQDIALLEHISQVAATAHAPFISAASPAMFGWDNFSEMYEINYVSRIFDQVQYTKWRSFRDSEASRYVGLCLPHILLREPYLQTSGGLFNFQESVLPESALAGFWGNAGYAFGSCVVFGINPTFNSMAALF